MVGPALPPGPCASVSDFVLDIEGITPEADGLHDHTKRSWWGLHRASHSCSPAETLRFVFCELPTLAQSIAPGTLPQKDPVAKPSFAIRACNYLRGLRAAARLFGRLIVAPRGNESLFCLSIASGDFCHRARWNSSLEPRPRRGTHATNLNLSCVSNSKHPIYRA